MVLIINKLRAVFLKVTDFKTMNPENRRQRRREYNRSERGKARHRRYRRSARGKAMLRENYRERVRLLDEIKSKAGCRVCKERNPKALSFVPRPGQKVKFPPRLENVTRSLADWKEVIAACDVLCRNCRAGRFSQIRGRFRKCHEFRARMPQVRRSGAAKAEGRGYQLSSEEAKIKAPQKCAAHFIPATEACKCCGREYFRRRSWQRTCSRECQLILLAAETFVRAYRGGRADGLYDIISELGGKLGA